MKMAKDKTGKIIPGLSDLAVKWMAMLKHWCPLGWQKSLPSLNFEQPDRLLPANSLPVLSYLRQMEAQSPPDNQPFIRRLNNLKSKLHFNQTYSTEDFGANFLEQYGWVKFLGPDAYWHSDQLSSGLVLLGDNITYPEHWHVAEELYFPISGIGDWYHESYGWQTKSPGDHIVHASNIKHSMRTNGEPLLLLYIWRGGDLVQKSDIH
jgi:hypothetical protein